MIGILIKYKKYIKYALLLLAGIAIVIALLLILRTRSTDEEVIIVEPGRVVDIRSIAELSSMEFYREATIVDTINNKVIIGIQKQQGSISFDLESLPSELAVAESAVDSLAGDTIHLTLPGEHIEVYESTDRNSWRVIDSKNLKLFGTSRLSPEEENLVKRKALEATRKSLLSDGTVERARKEASENLRIMTEKLTNRPVAVSY